jgi:thiaminase/transcriptional activator TenA
VIGVPVSDSSFGERLVAANRPVWRAMAAHPLVLGVADGTLPPAPWRAWVQQDRVFVVEERRVAGALRAHGPPPALERLCGQLEQALAHEADAFAAEAERLGFPADAEPWPICLGYTSYLLEAARDGLLEGLTALFGVERAYLDTWTAVRAASLPGSAYHAWIQNWTSQEFRAFVDELGRLLDELAGAPPPALAARLQARFARVARFELAFWEMAWRGWDWPR